MLEQLSNLKNYKGTQTDVRNYDKAVVLRVRELDEALYLAYLKGLANGFNTGCRIGERRAGRP